MRLGRNIALGAWILIVFNLLLAFGSIWGFLRMAPSIERVNERNARSLEATEKMLIALTDEGFDPDEFESALTLGESNVTERGEREALDAIRKLDLSRIAIDPRTRAEAVAAIVRLADSNRAAMADAAKRTRALCTAGAWGVVFMALAVFCVGIVFEQRLRRGVADPLEELRDVLRAQRGGDRMRRCSGAPISGDMKELFLNVNELIDELRGADSFRTGSGEPKPDGGFPPERRE